MFPCRNCSTLDHFFFDSLKTEIVALSTKTLFFLNLLCQKFLKEFFTFTLKQVILKYFYIYQ